jgi:hypothetical protein
MNNSFYMCENCFKTCDYLSLIFNPQTDKQNSPCCHCSVEVFDTNGEHIREDGTSYFYEDFMDSIA